MDDLMTLKKRICKTIDENRDAFIALGHSALREPETAFSEFKTAEKVCAALSDPGLQCRTGQAVTGITADLHGRSDAAMIALMGELDAIILSDYPFADKTTGAAIGLIRSGVMSELDGSVRFMAVPADEGIDIQGRARLIREGKIKAFNGKQEFIRLGLFDGVSAALVQRTTQGGKVSAGGAGGLCVVPKLVRYKGRSAYPINAHIA